MRIPTANNLDSLLLPANPRSGNTKSARPTVVLATRDLLLAVVGSLAKQMLHEPVASCARRLGELLLMSGEVAAIECY